MLYNPSSEGVNRRSVLAVQCLSLLLDHKKIIRQAGGALCAAARTKRRKALFKLRGEPHIYKKERRHKNFKELFYNPNNPSIRLGVVCFNSPNGL